MSTYTVRPISDRTAFTGRHQRTPFSASWSSTSSLLRRELGALSAKNTVLEVDVLEGGIRIDGQMKANARVRTPAVRLAFDSSHGPLTYATDRFWSWQDNVRAIALGLEALRRVDRYGITERGEQYTGFKALGAGQAMPASHMTVDEAWSILGSYQPRNISDLRASHTDDELRAAFRRARAANHPDRRDGDRALWDQVETAAKVLGLIS